MGIASDVTSEHVKLDDIKEVLAVVETKISEEGR